MRAVDCALESGLAEIVARVRISSFSEDERDDGSVASAYGLE
jgi:hypothetical protein